MGGREILRRSTFRLIGRMCHARTADQLYGLSRRGCLILYPVGKRGAESSLYPTVFFLSNNILCMMKSKKGFDTGESNSDDKRAYVVSRGHDNEKRFSANKSCSTNFRGSSRGVVGVSGKHD